MKKIATLFTLLALTGCNQPCERPHIELITDENGNTVINVPENPKENNIRVTFEVIKRDSKTVLKCSAKYYATGPNDPNAPNTLRVKVCANRECGMENSGSSVKDYWPAQWSKLHEIDKITCLVYQPEYRTCVEGFALIGECFEWENTPKRMVYNASAPVEHVCLLHPSDPYADYCKGGYWDNEQSRFVCTEGWY